MARSGALLRGGVAVCVLASAGAFLFSGGPGRAHRWPSLLGARPTDVEALCKELATTSRFRPQREALECPIVPGGLRDLASPRGALVAAARRADQGRALALRPEVLELVAAVEALNPNHKPLEAPEVLTACWQLIFTTSDSILGLRRPRLFKPRPLILQSINAFTLRAKNEEWTLRGLLKNSVRASLRPREDGRTVDVQFTLFGIGWLAVPAPKAARGVLETTYLDDDLRISRGDRGNVFVLVRSGETRI